MIPYITKDVATEPPTTVVIVANGGGPPLDLANKDETVFVIAESCIEPTDGWQQRDGRPPLTICFMHSFGRCAGKNNSDPRTCFQIHVNRSVLSTLRCHYTYPIRRYFTRTVKAQLSPELRRQFSMRAHKELKVQYLEYRVQDALPSTGLLQYEASYRQWLFSEDASPESSFNVTVLQCPAFASTGSCPLGAKCTSIHANPKNAQVRDPVLSRALREISDSASLQSFVPAAAAPTAGPTTTTVHGCDSPTVPQPMMPIFQTAFPQQQQQQTEQQAVHAVSNMPIYALIAGDGNTAPHFVPVQCITDSSLVPVNYTLAPKNMDPHTGR